MVHFSTPPKTAGRLSHKVAPLGLEVTDKTELDKIVTQKKQSKQRDSKARAY